MACINLKTGYASEQIPRTVLGLGNFDGVHLAHQELLKTVRVVAERCNRECVTEEDSAYLPVRPAVWTFARPSSDYLSVAPVGHLCTLDERLELFAKFGIEYAFVEDFESFREVEAEDFIERELKERCRAVKVVCGYNFRFGAGGAGTPRTLEKDGFGIVMPRKTKMGGTISSSRIRWTLRAGDAELATSLLGRPYSLSGIVEHGRGLGHNLGMPTLNLRFGPDILIPRRGVYVTEVAFADHRYAAVTNIGFRPSVEQGASLNCESHLLDFSGDLYGAEIRVSFLRRLRDEKQFSDLLQLREQMTQDAKQARDYYSMHEHNAK
ncbi:MAG: riboflavin biosynthesis protein RibF [Clostridia bacterium]|nr:riboflavin biosynthesis protein RibF [Clostridia bacterium]